MALNAGDIITYNGSIWLNQQYIQGSLGVGMTTAPQATLHVKGNGDLFLLEGTDQVRISLYPDGYAAGRKAYVGFPSASNDNLNIVNQISGAAIVLVTTGGTVSVTSPLQVSGPIATAVAAKTAAYTVTAADSVITGDATSAAFTITLPSAPGCTGRQYTLKKTDSSGNAVTVGTTSSQTIDGATTYALSAQWKYVTVVSNGSNWLVTANN